MKTELKPKILYFFLIFLFFSYLPLGHASLCQYHFSASGHSKQDYYRNFTDLSGTEKEGLDFRIVEQDRDQPVTIIAPHGGKIEPGTSEVATAIAASDFNLYLFEGIKPDGHDNFILHITSANFDEPRALAIMRKSYFGISIHGFIEDHLEIVEVGGANLVIAASIVKALNAIGIATVFPSKRYPGQHPQNIVNQAKNNGVQLEISTKLLQQLVENRDRLTEFSRAIRGAPLN